MAVYDARVRTHLGPVVSDLQSMSTFCFLIRLAAVFRGRRNGNWKTSEKLVSGIKNIFADKLSKIAEIAEIGDHNIDPR
jgi:hypothetical protein